MNNKGQSILSEYVMIFFVVIAAATAMTVFVQRAFEARVHDAKDYAIDSLTSSGACDANCLQATGGNIAHEYEPYYTASVASVLQNQQEGTGLTPGNAQITGTIFNKATSEKTGTIGYSCQLPAECANNPTGCECQCPSTC